MPRPDQLPEDDGPIGIFPSWGWVYAAVLVWFVILLVMLYVFTVTLDYGGP